MLNKRIFTAGPTALDLAMVAYERTLVDTRSWAESLTVDTDAGYSSAVIAAVLRDAIPADKA